MPPVSVLVVDDSVVVRRLVSDVLAEDPAIEVVGTAVNGKIALEKIAQLGPDLVTLDIEMPVMDGLETLVALRAAHPRLPVIMFSTLTELGASATLDALERGANDYVTKPANVGSVTAAMDAVRAQLIPRIKALTGVRTPHVPAPAPARRVAPAVPARTGAPPDVVVIGSSTGGPDALATVIGALPADLPVPVAIVQHMPPVFTGLFAQRLDARSGLTVREAQDGDVLRPGTVLIAPGDHHLRLRSTPAGVVGRLDQGPQENYCRPAVDVLFRSATEIYGPRVLAVVLTGMGSDGARGAATIVEAGGSAIVQDQATSVVWGMPGAVVAAGVPAEVLPLADVGAAILSRLQRAGTEQRRAVLR
ncbi:MAG: chemotaxis response regulator protein-glutamate methylesterase [Nocardioidaceae bacterium]|nr:chemotaxis response regulator protein-glutamate methylesterase [Nocardioidaceae bacterium]